MYLKYLHAIRHGRHVVRHSYSRCYIHEFVLFEQINFLVLIFTIHYYNIDSFSNKLYLPKHYYNHRRSDMSGPDISDL